MKKFIYKNLLFVIFVVIIVTTYCVHMHNYILTHSDPYLPKSHMMNYSLSFKRLKAKTQPSIILLGGSGCGFGFLSQQLSEQYNMPVINTGTHAGIGLRLIMNAAEPYIAEGDIILLIPEYAHFANTFFWGEEVAIEALYSAPEMFETISFFHILHLLKYYPKYYQYIKDCSNVIVSITDTTNATPYSFCSLNEYGDVTLYEKRNHKDSIRITNDGLSNINYIALFQIKEFIEYVESKGATCIFLPPAYRDEQYDTEKDDIKNISKKLAWIGIPYQASTERYRLPDSLYYDTPYHLTYDGCVYRTKLVIEDIDSILKIEDRRDRFRGLSEK